MCRYGSDALYGCLEAPMNNKDWESFRWLRNVRNNQGRAPAYHVRHVDMMGCIQKTTLMLHMCISGVLKL